MFFEKLEKTLLVISSIVYIAYVVFIGGMISIFKEYVGNEYLRTKIVNQIREQTRLTQDSANVSTKDMYFIFQVMGQLAWAYFALLIVLFLLLIYVLISFLIFLFIISDFKAKNKSSKSLLVWKILHINTILFSFVISANIFLFFK